MNTLGNLLRITSFGESHGTGVGVVVDGFPAGFQVDFEAIQHQLDRRRPGQSAITTQRKESDEYQVMSGVFEGKTTGAPIAIFIPNEDQKSKDYNHLKEAYRPSHADFTYQEKYGHRDHRGGGRSSARVTAGWVAAGALAQQWLSRKGVTVVAFVDQVGVLRWQPQADQVIRIEDVDANPVRCPDATFASNMEALIRQVRKDGDTVGGVVQAQITGLPVGLGEPLFAKLHAALGHAMLSINAAKGFEYGLGFDMAGKRGSEVNDGFVVNDGKTSTTSNFSGGIQGGISNGMPVTFRVAFKPVATIMQPQESVNTRGESIVIEPQGRHDPCVVPRAVPIVEALAALVVMDFWLLSGQS
jgi:chorismate synthase